MGIEQKSDLDEEQTKSAAPLKVLWRFFRQSSFLTFRIKIFHLNQFSKHSGHDLVDFQSACVIEAASYLSRWRHFWVIQMPLLTKT